MATILVVDDRPINRQFLVTLLGYAGHRLLEAADGTQALDIARNERPDLVITDILMPRMDGYDLAQHLQADPALASTPLIFYTATYRLNEAHTLARLAGVTQVLSKPSKPGVILDTVAAVLGAQAAPAPLVLPAPAEAPPLPPATAIPPPLPSSCSAWRGSTCNSRPSSNSASTSPRTGSLKNYSSFFATPHAS